MLQWFKQDTESNQKGRLALIETTTFRLVAYIEKEKVFTDVWLIDEVKMLLEKLNELSEKQYLISGNFIKFITDNKYNPESNYNFTLTGLLRIDLDDLNEHKKNVIYYNGYDSISKTIESGKVEPSIVDWTLTKKPVMKTI